MRCHSRHKNRTQDRLLQECIINVVGARSCSTRMHYQCRRGERKLNCVQFMNLKIIENNTPEHIHEEPMTSSPKYGVCNGSKFYVKVHLFNGWG